MEEAAYAGRTLGKQVGDWVGSEKIYEYKKYIQLTIILATFDLNNNLFKFFLFQDNGHWVLWPLSYPQA